MSNRSRAFLVALVQLVAMVLLLAGPMAEGADAKPPDHVGDPAVEVTSHIAAEGDRFSAEVRLTDRDLDLAAVSGVVSYDPTHLVVHGCSSAGDTICNPQPGKIYFAVFNSYSLAVEATLFEFDVEAIDLSVPARLELAIDKAYTVDGARVQVAVADGQVSADGQADAQGAVNGAVLDVYGAGVYDIDVCASTVDGARSGCATTNSLGGFEIGGLVTGDYRLDVTDHKGAFASTSVMVSVTAPHVSTGVVATVEAASVAGADDGGPGPAELPDAAAGEIVARVALAGDGTPLFGIEVCATLPVVETSACAFTDGDGVARIDDLGTGNYRLTTRDPAERFTAAEPVFVGLNPGAGQQAELEVDLVGLGDAPDALAYVEDRSVSEARGVLITVGAFGALLLAARVRRRS